MKIVCLGDSITGQSNLEAYLKWSHILECMLEVKMGEGNITTVNCGIGGDTTGGALNRLQQDVLDENPDIVVILLGGNDAGQKIPREETKTNLETIIKRTRDGGAKVLLLQYHLLVNSENETTAWKHLVTNNDIIAELGNSENVPLLDMDPPMQEALKKQSLPELVNAQDGVHLNPGGELVFAKAVYKKLISIGAPIHK